MSWLLLIVFSCWLLTIWVWEDCNSKCSCLYCVVFCSLVSVALSGSYEGVVAVYCLAENSSQILIRCCHGRGILVKCVSMYWELRNGEGLGRMREPTGGKKSGCDTRMCFNPLGIGPRVRRGTNWESAGNLGLRLGSWTWRRCESGDPKLTYLLWLMYFSGKFPGSAFWSWALE